MFFINTDFINQFFETFIIRTLCRLDFIIYFFINIKTANNIIPAPSPINMPATKLSNRNPHPIPKNNQAGINTTHVVSFAFFSLYVVVIKNDKMINLHTLNLSIYSKLAIVFCSLKTDKTSISSYGARISK